MWSSGSQILYREVAHGKVWTARPVTVIQDAQDLVALLIGTGTHWKICTPADPGADLLSCKANLRPWQLNDAVWSFGDTLVLISPGKRHAVYVTWDGQQEFVGWYVNLQEPIRRTSLGFDYLDQELDIVVSPDLQWRWKDRDHLEEAQRLGLYTPEQAGDIVQEGLQVVDDMRRKAVPFDGSWNDWKPPSDWTIPSLPDGWDQVG